MLAERSRPARRLARSSLGICLLALLLGAQPVAAQGVKTSPGEILSNPDRFDHQTVTEVGTVMNLQERVSKAGNAHYTLDLSDGG